LRQHPASAGDRFKRGKHHFGHHRGQLNCLSASCFFHKKRFWLIPILFASRGAIRAEGTEAGKFLSLPYFGLGRLLSIDPFEIQKTDGYAGGLLRKNENSS
jgi:hypothetical protein